MEFFIRKNATLPVLGLDIFKNGRTSFLKLLRLLSKGTA
jgi:hypothetical protein